MRDIVAGAGIWGCTLARRLAEARRKVLVLEKRAAVGGNCACEIDPETGIEIHTYGSHIFHTHNRMVWDFVRRFTEFNGYQHKVLVNYKGKVYHLPLGLTLINKFFGVELKPGEVESFLNEERRHAIFDAFFRGYTSKQWGKTPEEIDPSIIRRVPVRNNYDTNYFNDYWQGIPADGYNKLFERLLDHPNIEVETEMTLKMVGTDLRAVRNPDSAQASLEIDCGAPGGCGLPVYYSGPIDALFGYKFGALPWRSLRFERETLNCRDFQGTTVMNYTEAEVPYTRIHEFKHYHPESNGGVHPTIEQTNNLNNRTIIMREYSKTWESGDEPYYPIASPESAALLKKYQDEVERFNTSTVQPFNLIVGGRLGGYKYYDMDQAMAAALELNV